MKNTEDLRNELIKLFGEVKNHKTDILTAKVMIKTSNEILKTAKLELQQNKHLGSDKAVTFIK